jgi:hypothetical protein
MTLVIIMMQFRMSLKRSRLSSCRQEQQQQQHDPNFREVLEAAATARLWGG